MTAQELFESEPLWKRCRKFDKWQLIHFAESYHKHVEHLKEEILKTEQTTEAEKSDEQPCFKHDVISSVCTCGHYGIERVKYCSKCGKIVELSKQTDL